MRLYWGDRVNGWRIWGIGFHRGRYVTVAASVNDWEAWEADEAFCDACVAGVCTQPHASVAGDEQDRP